MRLAGYDVTAIAMNRSTRAQVGSPRTERIDHNTNALFAGCKTALQVERAYESFWNKLNGRSAEIVKVIDVTPVFKMGGK